MAAATGAMTDAARTVMSYLYSTREAYHQRPATEFRDLVGAQVIFIKADDIGGQARSRRRDDRDLRDSGSDGLHR